MRKFNIYFWIFQFFKFKYRIKHLKGSGTYDDWMENCIKDNGMESHFNTQVEDTQQLDP
jgi:hypothetical protein